MLTEQNKKKAVHYFSLWNCLSLFIYLGFLRRFQHCTGHITMGSWKGRGNQYIQLVKILYCKLSTNDKQLPAFPLEAVPGTEPRPQRREAGGESVTTLPPWPPWNCLPVNKGVGKIFFLIPTILSVPEFVSESFWKNLEGPYLSIQMPPPPLFSTFAKKLIFPSFTSLSTANTFAIPGLSRRKMHFSAFPIEYCLWE